MSRRALRHLPTFAVLAWVLASLCPEDMRPTGGLAAHPIAWLLRYQAEAARNGLRLFMPSERRPPASPASGRAHPPDP